MIFHGPWLAQLLQQAGLLCSSEDWQKKAGRDGTRALRAHYVHTQSQHFKGVLELEPCVLGREWGKQKWCLLFSNKNSLSAPGGEVPQAASARRRASGGMEMLPEPRAQSLHRLLRSTFQELSIQAGRRCLRRAHGASGGSNADTVLWLGPCLQTSSGLRRPKQEQRSPRGEIFQQIPKVWKDSSLQGSGPKSVIILITQAVII